MGFDASTVAPHSFSAARLMPPLSSPSPGLLQQVQGGLDVLPRPIPRVEALGEKLRNVDIP